ncbi:MAG: GNAT family N-acetyltransferase [Micromonosporaceae bacterium]
MLPPQVLNGGPVRLRPFRTDDADDVMAGCADPLTQRFLPLLPAPYTRQEALRWIHEGAPNAFAGGGAAYAMVDPSTDRVLGGTGIGRVHENASGELGYWVAPWARQRGVATAAARALSAHAFGHGFARLALRTDPVNAASQRVAIAAGFTREGLQRAGGLHRDGSRHDLFIWSRLATDSGAPTPRRLPDLPGGQLTDGVIVLRPVQAADVAVAYELLSRPEVAASSVPPLVPTFDQVAARFATEEASWLAGDRAHCSVLDAATGTFTGDIGLFYFEPSAGQAMIGYNLLPAWRGLGYATRAVRLIAAWAFDQVGVARLIAGTSPENVGSQRVLERAGFRQEGYQRARLPGPDGTRVDDLLYALLPDDPR